MRNRSTVSFIGLWELLHNPEFNCLEFEAIKKESGDNGFVMTPKRWIEVTGAVGIVSKQGRYVATYAHRDMRDYIEYSCMENILYLIKHKDIEDAGVDLMSCNAPGISFYISQAEVIKLLNPNMYRDIVLIDGDMDFIYSKTITKDSFIE